MDFNCNKILNVYSVLKGNSEVIMAVSYMEGEAENSLSRGYTYSLVSGTTNKDSFRENGKLEIFPESDAVA